MPVFCEHGREGENKGKNKVKNFMCRADERTQKKMVNELVRTDKSFYKAKGAFFINF